MVLDCERYGMTSGGAQEGRSDGKEDMRKHPIGEGEIARRKCETKDVIFCR